jgi:hypothetical protein
MEPISVKAYSTGGCGTVSRKSYREEMAYGQERRALRVLLWLGVARRPRQQVLQLREPITCVTRRPDEATPRSKASEFKKASGR